MPNRELTDGSTAIVRGAMAAGCDFFAGYPITPASPILAMMLRELPKVGGTGIQGEDEIASIGMCIGAAMAGARAMTATSGPGLSLYSENIGLAIMGEVPIVIVNVQRLGPATGGATTVGQGDVQFVRWGTAGGYPIIALAPSSIPECVLLTRRAFELAHRFRCPVFVLADKELDLTLNTVDLETPAGLAAWSRHNGKANGAATTSRPASDGPADVASPMARFGDGSLLRFTGSTHDERGFITKDAETIGRLNHRLTAKIEDHRDEIEWVTPDLEPGADTLFLSFGVTAGAMRDAVATARAGGRQVSALTVLSLWPVPETAIRAALEGVSRVVVAELNHGQYRREIDRIAGDREVVGLNRNDGELLAPEQFLELL